MSTIADKIKCLPNDLIQYCIIPYTYQIQNKDLLRDIRTYKKDINLLDNIYGTMYTNSILLYDLKRFCQIPHAHGFGDWLEAIDVYELDILPRCFTLWRRHFLYKNMTNTQIHTHIINFDIIRTSKQRLIMFLWGLLLPEERTDFINKYILDT